MIRRRDSSRRELLASAGVGAGALALAACARAPHWTPGQQGRRLEGSIVVDVHCHIFNASDLPITGFIARTIPGLSELSRSVTPVPEQVLRKVVGTIHGWLNAEAPSADAELPLLRAALANWPDAGQTIGPVPPLALPRALLDRLGDQIATLLGLDAGGFGDGFVRLAETLHLVGHARARIAASLALTYPSVSLFTPLLVDYDAWSDDHAQSPLAAQVPVQELISQLSIRGRIGRGDARFHPFIAFDPLRAGALAIVRDAVERAGFVGVKLYPPVGFLPLGNAGFSPDAARGQALDQALRGLYATCEAEEIPITAHASPANEFALGYGQLAAPERWAPVLREFPNLRLNFGHFGHETGVGSGAQGVNDDVTDGVEARHAWMRQAAELIEEHAHVYADLSSSPLIYDAAYASRFGAHLQALCARFRRLPSRLMYGSDWWLNRFEPGAATAVAVFQRRLEDWLGPGGRDAVMGRNALRFLGLLDQDDRLALGNRNHQRLRAFYGAAPPPAWLA
jgi:predicted TIM-barrel fold metal-dependent hydrolase